MWQLTKPRIRHCSASGGTIRINWIVDFPGDVFPWPCRTWRDALDAVERWYGGSLFTTPGPAA